MKEGETSKLAANLQASQAGSELHERHVALGDGHIMKKRTT